MADIKADFLDNNTPKDEVHASWLNDVARFVNAGPYVTDTDIASAQLVVPNPRTAAYTLVLTDANKSVDVNAAAAVNVTVPNNASVAYLIGTVMEVCQMGIGQVTLLAAANVTLRPATCKTRAQYSAISLRKQAVDTWIVGGDLA